ncbi:MAG: hypothetical protein FJ271_19165 [Planctomycetes bacterium]|nr:hypothetical protein [Planctomycetota bacterium]
MRYLPAALVALAFFGGPSFAYIEAPHTLGLVVRDSSHIIVMQVARVDKDKGLIVFRKVEDLKGKHPRNEIKHNIGKRGFHPREWQNIMNWAREGHVALFFHNGGASETCIGSYWYQCYPEGEWWAMSHAEPFLLRTFSGRAEKLAEQVKAILQNKEVVVTALEDGNKNNLHLRKGKVIRMKASLKRLDWNPRRDFAGLGGDGDVVEEFRTINLLAESSPGWKYLPAASLPRGDRRWSQADYDDRGWRTGRSPIGYGEEEIRKRQGTLIKEQGVPFCFRRTFQVSADLLRQKDVVFRLAVASDDSAVVHINGQLADQEPENTDHEFAYWNRDIELPARLFQPGTNLVTVLVRNKKGSSDLYLDMEITAQVPLPRVALKVAKPLQGKTAAPASALDLSAPKGDPKNPARLTVDAQRRAVVIPARIAQRKLPQFNDVYPLEVVATYPAPRGQKAHETVVSFTDIRPSEVHRGLEKLGLKAGKPARGDGIAAGPEVRVLLEYADAAGKSHSVPVEKRMVDKKTNKPLPPLRWRFTGSAIKQPDPEKSDKVYGADMSGTLITLFPVTDDVVLQSTLTMKDEPLYRLERVKGLPAEGTTVRLVIEAKCRC